MVAKKSARQHAREHGALDGADAQALEGALTMTERERDEARQQLERLIDSSAEGSWMARALDAERERDEWRQQHENALACWSADLRALTAKHEALAVLNTCVTPHDGGRVLRPHSIPGWWQVWSGGVCVCLLRPEDAIFIRWPPSDEQP